MKAVLRNIIRIAISWTAWPGLLLLCLLATGAGFAHGIPVIAFNITYFSLAIVLLLLERWMPHEVAWTRADGQLGADILHTLVSKGAVQTLIVFSSAIGLAALITPLAAPGNGIWPRHWPLWAQVVLALTAAEFGLYWGHHIAHKWKPLWRFHAVHHSVKKLWVVNTGRFHFVDSIKSIVPALAILVLLGAPLEVVTWLSAITAYIGMLTHCNIEMRFGYLSWVFNTPELHRWHHSKDLREGDKNFGENLMVWDWIFGTYFNENRRPPVDIGIKDEMPARFRDQLVWPFRRPVVLVDDAVGAAGARE